MIQLSLLGSRSISQSQTQTNCDLSSSSFTHSLLPLVRFLSCKAASLILRGLLDQTPSILSCFFHRVCKRIHLSFSPCSSRCLPRLSNNAALASLFDLAPCSESLPPLSWALQERLHTLSFLCQCWSTRCSTQIEVRSPRGRALMFCGYLQSLSALSSN